MLTTAGTTCSCIQNPLCDEIEIMQLQKLRHFVLVSVGSYDLLLRSVDRNDVTVKHLKRGWEARAKPILFRGYIFQGRTNPYERTIIRGAKRSVARIYSVPKTVSILESDTNSDGNPDTLDVF